MNKYYLLSKNTSDIILLVGGIVKKRRNFENNRTWCLGDKMGELGIENIQDLNNPKIKSLVRKI